MVRTGQEVDCCWGLAQRKKAKLSFLMTRSTMKTLLVVFIFDHEAETDGEGPEISFCVSGEILEITVAQKCVESHQDLKHEDTELFPNPFLTQKDSLFFFVLWFPRSTRFNDFSTWLDFSLCETNGYMCHRSAPWRELNAPLSSSFQQPASG